MTRFTRRVMVPLALAAGLALPLGGIASAAPSGSTSPSVSQDQAATPASPSTVDSTQIEQLQNLQDMLEKLTATTSPSEFRSLLEDYSADIKDNPALLSEDARSLINEASDMVGSGNSYGLGGIVDLLKGLLGTVLDLVGGLLDGLLGGLPLPAPDLPVPALPVPDLPVPGVPGGGGAPGVPALPLPTPALPVPDLPVPDLPVPAPALPVPALPGG